MILQTEKRGEKRGGTTFTKVGLVMSNPVAFNISNDKLERKKLCKGNDLFSFFV